MNSENKRGILVVLSGPSGCGKDTVMSALSKRDESICLSVSATTRPQREGETDGVDYYFLSTKQFESKIENDEFVEYVQYAEYYYGTLKSEIERIISGGKSVVLVIEVKGAANIISKYPDCLSVFLMPPSLAVLESRLRKRATEDNDTIERRMRIAEDEIEKSKQYKYVVVNDNLDTAIETVYNIIDNYRK